MGAGMSLAFDRRQAMTPGDDGRGGSGRRGNGDAPSVPNADAVVAALNAIWAIVRRDGVEQLKPLLLRSELQRVTVEARAANIPPEQLLWMLKSSWRGLPEVRRVDRPEVTTDLLGQLVTVCIEEYFAGA